MSEPTQLAGYVDDSALTADSFGAAVDFILEAIPDLVHPRSVTTFAKMRHDPQIKAVLRAYYLAITRARWVVDGDGCRDEVTALIADDLGLPVKGSDDKPTGARRRGFTWGEHLRLALGLSTTFGHAPFAQRWVEQAGKWRLQIVQERMPQTIAGIHLNRDGTLASAEQGSAFGAAKGRIPTANHQLVWYAREREGSNYFGQSLIREAYSPWLMKTEALRKHMTAISRFSMGIPEVQAPDNLPASIAAAQRYAQQMGKTGGAGIPPGYVSSWRGMTGTIPDAPGFITMLDRYITRATLASILDMATAERGNRSLGETVMDLMVMAQQSEADRIAADATAQIVVPLVDANWGEGEPAPRIVCGDVGADLELTAQDVNWLFQYAALTPDEPTENWIRQRYHLPAKDLNAPQTVTPAAPASTPAPTDPTPEAQ